MYCARPFAHIRRKGAEAYDGFSTLPDTFLFNILPDSTDAYSRPPPKVVAAQRITPTFIPLSLICLFHIQRGKGRNSHANKQIKTITIARLHTRVTADCDTISIFLQQRQ